MGKLPTNTTVRLWARLVKAQRIAFEAIEQALKSSALPPLAWYDVLLELERAEEHGLRPFELEREILLAQYNLSRLVERIENAGYVARRACKDDGRGHVIVITAAGKQMRRRMWTVYAAAIQHALGDRFSTGEAETLVKLLGTLSENPVSD